MPVFVEVLDFEICVCLLLIWNKTSLQPVLLYQSHPCLLYVVFL